MLENISNEIISSWNNRKGNVSSMQEIKEWISSRNKLLKVSIDKIHFSYDGFWHYDEKDGFIRNDNNSFFQLAGYQEYENNQIINEQPIIIQNEIGYLGIICKKINGVLNFLMQAKIEPGNVNVIQISPTIQATKSNFTRQHGGNAPAYLDYFLNPDKDWIIIDQIQSEQSSRFYKKRNRNIIIYVEDDIPVYESHKWMTLGQIKELMKINNLVNMDTRTVLSCLPISFYSNPDSDSIFHISDLSLYKSIFKTPDYGDIHTIFNSINDIRMFKTGLYNLVSIKDLKNWVMTENEIVCKKKSDFKVIYCKIEIEGREVKQWEQPLIEAIGTGLIGCFTCIDEGIRKYLVRIKPEIGCFDSAELGPAIQLEPTIQKDQRNNVEELFISKFEKKENIKTDVVLSEEGGRFYHEQNRNVIIEILKNDISLPKDYFWMDYATISCMIQFNNCVNIQLRNLMALVDF